MGSAAVRVRRHIGCLRGLHYLFTLGSPPDAAALARDLEQRLPGQLVRATEHWGPRLAHRLIFQFRFEVRIVEGQADVALLHRACADEDARERDRRWLLCVLSNVVEPPTHAATPENA